MTHAHIFVCAESLIVDMLHAEGSVYNTHCGGERKKLTKEWREGNEHGKVWGEEEEASFSE